MKLLKKTLALISVFLLLFYQVYFPLAVFAQEATPSASEEPASNLQSTPTPIPTTEASSSASPTPEPSPVPISDWQDVITGHLYVAPQNSKVTVKFNKLPDNKGRLTIKEVTLTDQQIAETKALSSTAYDISSDMENNTFEYTLTLPSPKTEGVEVKASEDGQTFVTLGGVTAQTDTLTITGLNHFTIFVIAGTITNPGPRTFIGEPFYESTSSAVINEFVYNPPSGQNEWIEILNKTGSEINLSDWTVSDTAGHIRELSGILPPNGLVVYINTGGGWINDTDSSGDGDTIYLKNGSDIADQVTYQQQASGTVIDNTSDVGTVSAGNSVYRTTDGGSNWVTGSPTKGWFNDAGEPDKAPLLSTIGDKLEIAGITSNIRELNNPSSTPEGDSGLYFEKTGEGKILFTTNLNLTNQATVAILQSLGEKMEMSNGHIKFDSQTAGDMVATGAKIYMYGLNFAEKPDIFIKNDNGELLGTNDPEAIGDISYDPGEGIDTGELSFTALHFTQFDLPSAPDIPVLNEVSSPTNDTTPTLSWDDISATPEVTSYEIEIYDSSEENIYPDTTITTTDTEYTLEDQLGDDDYTWYVRANNSIGSSDWSDGESFTIDTTAPTVTKLDGGSADVALEAGETNLWFSEALSNSSKTAVENTLTAGVDKELSYYWNDSYILTITATEETTFANDVVVNVSDIAGNSAELLIVDSALASTQTAPETAEDGSGDATLNNENPEVVITDPDQEVDITIDSGTDNPTIDVSSFISEGTGTLPKITIDSEKADIVIPASTVVTSADTSWNGVIAAPTVTTVTLPETSGQTKTLSTAIEVGFTGAKLSFDKAVRILLPDQAGKRAGYVRTGIEFTEITDTCSADNQATGDALAADGDCKIDVGSDLVIWTKHFTQFAAYTQTASSSSSSTTQALSPAGGGGTPPVCNDQKPGSAPALISAITDTNSVTLNWNKALNPITYYLATYGLSTGSQQYGNPSIGGPDTTSYKVQGLSGGVTYYFKVRAGNGCAPGDFSNELSATPGGEVVSGPAVGFATGVLGVSTQETSPSAEVKGESATSESQPSATIEPQTAEQSPFNVKIILVVVIALIIGFGVFRLVIK